MENFRTLKLSNYEKCRTLKSKFNVLDVRVRKYCNLERFRALKLSKLESFRMRKYSFRVIMV
jgi:hypothetical protein